MGATIALFAGDPLGIGPELVAKLLSAPVSLPPTNIHLIAQRASLAAGAEAAGLTLDVDMLTGCGDHVARVEWDGWDAPAFQRGEADGERGAFMLKGLRIAMEMAHRRHIDAVCFAPVDRSVLRAGGMSDEDELHWFADVLGHHGPCGELNVLDNLWTSRVTSHVPFKNVAGLLTAEGVAQAIATLAEGLRRAGNLWPKIAVCALNPHNGDNGSLGREEIDVIEPGIRLAATRGLVAAGPYPADTIFVQARNGAFDGVVTMYHDQAQIAMKLLGFERGVTVQGGLPVMVTTPAHGTAYDIVGKGIANPWALRNAIALAVRMAASGG